MLSPRTSLNMERETPSVDLIEYIEYKVMTRVTKLRLPSRLTDLKTTFATFRAKTESESPCPAASPSYGSWGRSRGVVEVEELTSTRTPLRSRSSSIMQPGMP